MPDIYTSENFTPQSSIGRQLTRARHLLLEIVSEELAPLQLTAAQWGVVVLLAEETANTPAELSRLLDYDPGAMTRLIDRLAEKGIVERIDSPDDRRSKMIVLTEQGKQLYPSIRPRIIRAHNTLLRGFSEDEARQLSTLLGKLMENAR
ncbi:MarR family winged helix-turn-helix transcriptional regulator [Chitinasiproducens palmae]|uniref:DNA-binding transcriptional regulator, MarR family n=1 Tax=Chitinasiproducens palmae TaxID=1770053 RepID=A0A1H2PPA3_9BURK|nr:MarR family transcriptional regulator [Chitinasiproducens palmae]SDV48569.1 DNA-binding transcriptional regulator, MarR family [Chitinasiproducens palmae]